MGNEKQEENTKKEKSKIVNFGNILLTAMIILVIATGGLTYYLIHDAKNSYDEKFKEMVSNLPEETEELENNTENEVDTIANIIDSAITEVSNNAAQSDTNSNKKLMNESLVVLYNGLILDTSKMDENVLQYIDTNSPDSDKYVITYYSYENYSPKDSSLGTLSSQAYDGLAKIDGVGKVAISEDYSAIPRSIKVVNTVPTIVSENNPKIADYDAVKTLITDLDGNGADEYILVMANKKIGFSKIILVDSNGVKKADLASIEKSKWKKDSKAEYYLSISNVELIDVDNDEIMEILIEIPHSTGNSTVSLLKYNNGNLLGKTNIECSLLSE